MNPGKLRERITIEECVEVVDEDGFSVMAWQTKAKAWAYVNNLFGKEYWTAKQYNAENTVEFTIRFSACKNISDKERIVFRSKVYNILSVDNVQYKNEYIKLKAKEVD